MITPRFEYNPGSGIVQFYPTYPPVQKPGSDERDAIRHDSITCSGLKQSVLERLDVLKTLQFKFVPFSDLVNWEPFMEWALAGGEFKYYPSATAAGAFGLSGLRVDGVCPVPTGNYYATVVKYRNDGLVVFCGSGDVGPINIDQDARKTMAVNWTNVGDSAKWRIYFGVTDHSPDFYQEFAGNLSGGVLTEAHAGSLPTEEYETYTLEDTNWKPAFAMRSFASFTLKMRKVAGS